MDCVYICRPGENEELRYSIRSIAKNFPGNRVWLVGSKPSWYSGDFIPVQDIGGKFKNISNAMAVVANNEDISEDFVLMNDDFFIVEPIKSIPVLHGGLLSNKIKEYLELDPGSRYAQILIKAQSYLNRNGYKDPLDYDIHTPMVMNRQKLKAFVSKTDAPRSVYGNMLNLGGELSTDVKVYSKFNKLSDRSYSMDNRSSAFLSCEDKSFSTVYRQILKDMFPDKSVYEK